MGYSGVTEQVSDERLRPVRDIIAAGSARVLSLDVFDTLVWRRVPDPCDVFLLLGHRLQEAQELARHITPEAFADLRFAAEKAARAAVQAVTGYREIKLVDIYALMPDHLFARGFEAAARIKAELACERDLLVLDRNVAALIDVAKQAGARVVLASDTYFTHDECVKVLKRYTPIIPEDMKRLGERVVAKHLKAIGYGHLVDKNMGPPLKTILYNHAEGRYFTHEQE